MKKVNKILSVFTSCLLPFALSAAELPQILSAEDVAVYQQIFELQSKEKIDAAIRLDKKVADPLLMGEVLEQRYTSKTYRTKGKEVADWLYKYYDSPSAPRMYKLAALKKAGAVRSPKLPSVITGTSIENAQSETWTEKKYTGSTDSTITKFRKALRGGNTKNARQILEDASFKKKLSSADYGRLAGRLSFVYYTNGEFELAKKFGFVSSDAKSEYGLWTMGLLYFKEQNFKESQKYFSAILDLPQINNARKTEAAFWAGRASDANDDSAAASRFWKIGASHQMAFYGALSATMLGDTPRYEFFEQEYDDDDITELQSSKYGKIALALLQANQKPRAEKYLTLLITAKATDRSLHAVNSIATVFGLPRVAMQVAGVVRDRGILEIDQDIIYSAQYPLPDWEPLGGWSIDRALLFAITKQESAFRTNAKSSAGANGVMQLMPGTAKIVARQNKVKMSDIDMSNPEHNMFLGQQHIVDLLDQPAIDKNIIKMLASYNAGLGMLTKFEKNFETSDPLLYIESFPAYETRSYVKRVMSNLWLYRAKLGQPLTGMEDLANGRWPRYDSEDDYVRRRIADRMAI
ncbi:MAG: lytic transglycosylase domain-containing protein [Rickettsiales bacterium]|jgi:soluble lytic murein transglycosylase-like protein|nr:lytic transglycosylase domain-containing protein [Rickettsiales bacterium]